jgi:phosphatidate phosphatase PAH1
MNPIAMIKEVFNAPYATVTYDSDKRFMLLIWNGSPSTEEYKQPFLTMLSYGKKFPVDSMLSDISKQGIINPDNRKWFEKEMMPQAVTAGLKRAAIVTSGNAFKLYYINLILSAVNKFPITTKLFNKRDEAITWLDTFPVSTHTL